MELEERVVKAQHQTEQREALIREYTGFIFSVVRKTTECHPEEADEFSSVAMLAFDEAVEKYVPDKGKFLSYAALVIRSRVLDELRRQKRQKQAIPMSALQTLDEDGEVLELQIADSGEPDYDVRFELEALGGELKKYGITFLDLAEASPKRKKTKKICRQIIRWLADSTGLCTGILKNGCLPGQVIMEKFGVGKKLLERHRKYLVAGVVIFSGEYGVIQQYFPMVDEKGGDEA